MLPELNTPREPPVAVAPQGPDISNILVVDDLQEKHLAYGTVLEELGQNVISVTSGAEALKQVLLHDFAVILLDVNMPEMDGFETARLIRGRKRSASTPVIFLTAFADEVRTAEGYSTGAVDYLSTPVVPAILRAKVRVFVELFQMRKRVAQQAEESARRAAAEVATRRLAFLAEAGAVLGRSLDLEATSRDLVRLTVPQLADLAVLSIDLPIETSWKRVVAQLNSDGRIDVDEPAGALPEELEEAIERARVAPDWAFFAGTERHAEPSGVSLPLEARGRTLAVLALSRQPSGRTFSPSDLAMAKAFASRAATALDNAVLHGEIQRADRQKNEFLSMLAHELRNPLAPIRNAAHLLTFRATNDPDVQWVRDVVERQVGQLVRLVDDLLDVSRISSGKIRLHCEPVALNVAVEHAVEASRPLVDARRQQLNVQLPAEPVWVNGDLPRLAQILTNLLNNAAKYTEDGGRIWLTVRREGDTGLVSVRDTGVGIPPHMLAAVFELFTQVDRTLDRSQGGLGIGLTLVQRLVEMHGGTVRAASGGQGRGSEFTVTLPLLQAPSPVEAPAEPVASAVPPSLEIVVVDDNADAADTLATLLRLSGHQVQVAYDGPSGLELALKVAPPVVLMDIGLPGLDGYSVAQRLRQSDAMKHALLIAISGYGQEKDEARSRQAGFDHHFVKPIDFPVLHTLLAAREADRKQMTNVNGGRIEARGGGPDQGSEFVVQLPSTRQSQHLPTPLTPFGSRTPLTRRRILIVDDTRAAAFVLGKLLESMGQTVRTVSNAAEALESVQNEPPHLVISDIAMPHMDGYELARRLRELPGLATLPIIALTGYGREDDMKRSLEAGFDYHLVKPVSLEALQSLLANLAPSCEEGNWGGGVSRAEGGCV